VGRGARARRQARAGGAGDSRGGCREQNGGWWCR